MEGSLRGSKHTALRAMSRPPADMREFCVETGTQPHEIMCIFGGWGQACRLAGVGTAERVVRGPGELLAGLYQLFSRRGVIGLGQIDALRGSDRLPASTGCYDRHFGGWTGTLEALREWLTDTNTPSEYLDELDERLARLRHRAKRTRVVKGVADVSLPASNPDLSETGRRLGEPLSDGTFVGTPTNEFGVAMYFGALAKRLGFQILSVHLHFPDFTATRCFPDGGWRVISGELKFLSSAYRDDHAAGKIADLLVVWRHDWTECPIPVLELSTLDFKA